MTEQRHTLAELCAVACAEAFRGDGEILASGIGVVPGIGARLARATFAPDLLLTDGGALLVSADIRASNARWGEAHRGPSGSGLAAGVALPDEGGRERPPLIEGWLPYRAIFDLVWSGRRHVMMGASQLDQHGNQNISCIGDHARPTAQLIGMRGAPGNTVHHATSYWVPNHSPRTFVERVDVVCGIGTDRARALGAAGRFHALRVVVTNKAVLDFNGPGGVLRLRSVHPGVSVADVARCTGCPLLVPADVTQTRAPTAHELHLLREVLDPGGALAREVAA